METRGPILHGPKRQHFLPRSYLNGFTKSGNLAVYDRETDDVRIQTPTNTAVIHDFYTMKDDKGRKRFEIESMLADYESKGIEAIRKLMEWKRLTSDQRRDLSILLALFVGRVPSFVDSIKGMYSDLGKKLARAMFNDSTAAKEILEQIDDRQRTSDDYHQEAEGIVRFIRADNYTINVNHMEAMRLAIISTLELAHIFANRNWILFHLGNPRESLITTDAPVVLTTTRPRPPSMFGIGFAASDAVTIVPLASSCLLVMSGGEGQLEHGPINLKKILELNQLLASRCKRLVIGRDRKLIQFLSKRISD